MAILKKEQEKRKRKQKLKEDDVFADILGMPKTKPKKKSAQKDDDD